MATKKSTKKNTRKRGRRYMKKAARRTIAALLMITALIVAAIPATPSRAVGPSGTDNMYINTEAGYACQFDSYTTPDGTKSGCRLIGVYALGTASGIDDGPVDPSGNPLPKIQFDKDQKFEVDGVSANCIAISNSVNNKECITYLDCPDVLEIPNGAFADCRDNLNEVHFASVTKINDNAFKNCTTLQVAEFSKSIDSIGNSAFDTCSVLKDFRWPTNSLGSIGERAFADSGITVINLPDTKDGAPATIGISAFENCGAESAKIGNGYTTINSMAFKNCKIKEITFPPTISTIQVGAFTGCSSLGGVTIPAMNQTGFFVENIFSDCTSLSRLSVSNNTATSNLTMETSLQYLPSNAQTSGFYMEGYRYFLKEGHNYETDAYKYCRYHGIPYRCLDSESKAVQEKCFTVTDDGELVDVDVAQYFANGYSETPNTLTIPASVTADGKINDVKSIASNIFEDKTSGLGQVEKIVIDSSPYGEDHELFISNGAFNQLTNLKEAEFTIDSVDFGGDGVFPSGRTADDPNPLMIIGNLTDESRALTYAMDYNYLYRGKDKNKVLTLYVKRYKYTDNRNNEVTCRNTLYQIGDGINTPYDGTYDGGALILPSGVHYIMPDYIKGSFNDKVNLNLSSFSADGLVGIFDQQFYGCLNLSNVSLPKTLKTIGNEPFLGCSSTDLADNFKINDSPYCSYSDGVIYAPDNGEDKDDNKDSSWNGEDTNFNKTLVQMLQSRKGDSFTVPSDVRKIRPGAFKYAPISEFHINKDAQVKRIPREAFNNSSVSKVYLGNPVTGIGDDAFKKLEHESIAKLPKIYVYSGRCGWNTENRGVQVDYNASSEEQPYYFICDDDTSTEEFCEKDGDNLIRLNIPLPSEEGDEEDLQTYQIAVKTSSKTKDLNPDGSAPDWKSSNNAIDGDGDYYVYKLNDKGGQDIVTNDNYTTEVMWPTVINEGDTINFYAKAIDGSGYINTTPTASFNISGGETPDGYSVKYVNGQTRDYTGKLIEWNASPNNTTGDFYVQKNGSTGSSGILDPTNDKDYNWSWDNNAKPTEPGSYGFTAYDNSNNEIAKGSVTINPKGGGKESLSSCNIVYTNGTEREYTGSVIPWTSQNSSDFYVEDKDGNTLVLDQDYTMDPLTEVKEIKHYAFTIHGMGNYTGSKTGGFDVVRGSVNPKASSLSVNLILNGPDRSAVSPETYKSTNTFQYWNEGDPGIKSVVDKFGNALKVGTDYTVQSYGTVKPGLGKNTGYVQIQFKGNYADEGRQMFFYDIKKDLSKNTSDDGVKSVTIQVTEATIDSDDKIEATVTLTDSTTGTDLVKDTDYLQGSFKKTSDHHADVKITGKGDKYVGTYTYNFHMDEKKSSSSSGKSSSSSSKSSSGSSSAKGSSSSSGTGGSSSTGGSGNRNSGTTVVNRNYYGNNGGTADELEDMLRAAHIDSINGGTADGYQVNITKSDEAERSFREALIRRYGSLDNIRYFSMDIDVKDENGNDIDTTGMSVTLTLPLPRSMEQYGTNNKIATVDSNGDLEDLNEQFSTLEGRPCVTFVAPHFSPYGFYVNTADLAVGTLDNTPKTGDPIHPKWFLSFGLAALSIFLFLKRDPKSQVKPA